MIPVLAQADFNLRALYDALDDQRQARRMTWTAVAKEINAYCTTGRPIARSTITGLEQKAIGEGDGILQMLIWLGRTPESFVPGTVDTDAERFRLPELTTGQVLRWDANALHTALAEQRRVGELTWTDVARQVGGFTPAMLTNLAKGGRVALPRVMRLPLWLGHPAVAFTRIARW